MSEGEPKAGFEGLNSLLTDVDAALRAVPSPRAARAAAEASTSAQKTDISQPSASEETVPSIGSHKDRMPSYAGVIASAVAVFGFLAFFGFIAIMRDSGLGGANESVAAVPSRDTRSDTYADDFFAQKAPPSALNPQPAEPANLADQTGEKGGGYLDNVAKLSRARQPHQTDPSQAVAPDEDQKSGFFATAAKLSKTNLGDAAHRAFLEAVLSEACPDQSRNSIDNATRGTSPPAIEGGQQVSLDVAETAEAKRIIENDPALASWLCRDRQAAPVTQSPVPRGSQSASAPTLLQVPSAEKAPPLTGDLGTRSITPVQHDVIQDAIPDFNGRFGSVRLPALPRKHPFENYASWEGQTVVASLLGVRDLDERHRLYVLQLVLNPEEYACHACTPLIAGFTTQRLAEGEIVVFPLQVLAPLGSFGVYNLDENSPTLASISPNKRGLLFPDSDMAQGEIQKWMVVIGIEKSGFNLMGTFPTETDRTATCADEAPGCGKVWVDYRFGPDIENGYYVIQAETHSLPKIRYAKETLGEESVAFDGTRYVARALRTP